MSAEGLRKNVLDNARAEADEILEQAEAEATAMLVSAREHAEAVAAEIVGKARREADHARTRALSTFEREIRLKTLEEKNRLLEEAFARAAAAFKSTPLNQLRGLYQTELAAIDLASSTVHVPPGAKAEFEAILAGRAGVQEDPSVQMGCVVVHADFRLDRSLAARLEEIRSEMRSQVAGMLFENQT